MRTLSNTQTKTALTNELNRDRSGILQRKCESCGQHTIAGGECTKCKNKVGLQRKLTIGASHDPLEQEADRIADQVMATPVNTAISRAPLHIQRLTEQPVEGKDLAPASVERVLSSPGTPLDPALQHDMEQRFGGYDFSHVRVHTGADAEKSAAAINALAYTAKNHIVFRSNQFMPSTLHGRKLLAHELAHTIQQKSEAQPVVQRDLNVPRNAPSQSADLLDALLPSVSPNLSKQFVVRALREVEFQALTGIKTDTIPQKQILSPNEAGLNSDSDAGASVGIAAGILTGSRPILPLRVGTTGVLWSADAHLSQFAVVPQENPALAFFFGDTTLKTYGFRSNVPLHFGSAGERIFNTAGGPLTALLNSGVQGNYVNDAIFPYIPLEGGSVAVHVQGGAENIPGAQELVTCMEEASRSGELKGTYCFSTPRRTSPAFDRAFGKGAAANPNFQPPKIANCLNQANGLTQQSLQGRDLILSLNGRDVNISTATFVDTGEPVPRELLTNKVLELLPGESPNMLPSAATNMRLYLAQWDNNSATQGLTRTPVTSGMLLRGLTGVLRIGGFVLMIYNLDRTYSRYELASEYDKPLVVGEEATQLTAGLLGSLIGEVIGEVVLCTGTGPALGLCVLATAALGGAVASTLTEDTAHSIGQTLQNAAELNRQGKLLPGIMDAATELLGSEQDKKLRNDLKRVEKGDEPSNGLWELFRF